MEKIKLKLGEVLQLETEINGYVDPKNGEVIFEGFTKQNLSIILKYELSDLRETKVYQEALEEGELSAKKSLILRQLNLKIGSIPLKLEQKIKIN